MASAAIAVYFGCIMFLANFVFVTTGFGAAIMFIFIYEIASLSGIMECCNLRYALVILSLGFFSAQLPMLCFVNLKQNLRLALVLCYIPIQFGASPLGQYLQNKLPIHVLKLICGIVIVCLASWKMFNILKARAKAKKENSATPATDGVIVNKIKDNVSGHEDEACCNPNDMNEDCENHDRNKDSADDYNIEAKDVGDVDKELNRSMYTMLVYEFWKDLWPVRLLRLWTVVAGFCSGFLSGLIGVGGPPLMIFFLLYPHPIPVIRANSCVIATISNIVKTVIYIVSTPPESYFADTWYVESEIKVYISVLILGLAAVPCGLAMSKYLNSGIYKIILAILLIISGITMIVTSVLVI